MANRPIFTPSTKKDLLVETHDIDFQWSPGMAASQKKKNVQALHSSASEKLKIDSVLEVSSKSSHDIGIQLSAFNLIFGMVKVFAKTFTIPKIKLKALS